MITIPTNLTDFLYWVKAETEAYWAKNPDDGYWITGAKWIGMKEEDIEGIEKKYKVKFTPEHREFLKILHAIDRKEVVEYTESWEEDAELLTKEEPFFYNWYEDETEIKERLDWPFETILQDVIGNNGVWLKSWGPRPATDEERTCIFREWYKQAPVLLPLFNHRFLVSDMQDIDKPVLSVYGSDIIVYGWDLRLYLLHELKTYCFELYKDEECEELTELGKVFEDLFEKEHEESKIKSIPFWEEMILYWSSGWWSFGKEYPRNTDGPSPIVNTYSVDDEKSSQKIFHGF